MSAIANLTTITIDCADPQALSRFYQAVIGGNIASADAEYALLEAGPIGIAFQRIEGYQAPQWPDAAAHLHFDLQVSEVEAAGRLLLEAGATKPEHQPGGGDWTVFCDPEGHAFCIAAG